MVPNLDKLIGISTYCTKTEGTGGKIKSSPEQFFVSEILRDKVLDKISSSGSYAIYKLKKQGIDTNHALSDIFTKYGLRLKALGLKDANATTEQYVCDMTTGRSADTLITNRYTLEKIGLVQKPLTKKDMVGNHFKIKIENADFVKVAQFTDHDKILNFFGYQRFGSKRPVSHIIGKAILQKNFDYAVETLLSFTSEYDLVHNNKVREMLKDKSNYAKVFDQVPPQMDIERIVLSEMISHDNPLKALRAIPIQLRRFFVEAFQSFVYNQTMSRAYEFGENMIQPQQGDVCFDKDDNLGRYENDPKQRLAIPLVGYSYSKKNRFDSFISQILVEQQITPKEFFVKEMQEASTEGGFRQAIISCNDFAIKEPYVEFTLSRGSYATTLLREIIKPSDPIAAGF
ncbi:tRNA pseudouridine(13) synthase TruD [Candidatus Nitrosotalea okcheonensis]|uniref:tRNA pseudouridine synthase D TruD n=1 Tax=Candidatus Nitrosotalea okcheonensis TaxID=1903276 RepID=A0A2H1FFQ5_9ARCH|nr:tRNA pseudouridine(13) synthase TruD [Candidatus Nitrosotalea okcheonensis]SMH71512.1 tRNA pseudouridine synthase D TruD [Candidatus Nitrosotalea okcheonensis]